VVKAKANTVSAVLISRYFTWHKTIADSRIFF